MTEINEDDYVTIHEAAKISRVSPQAIYLAVRKGGLTAIKRCNQWYISKAHLEEYRLNKYSRDKRKHNGEFVYDLEKGHLSVLHVSKVISSTLKRPFTVQRLYYMLRHGELKGFRVGAAWVVLREDAVALLEREQAKEANYIARII